MLRESAARTPSPMRREGKFFMLRDVAATNVISSSDILQRGHADLRHDMKHPRPSKESVSHPGVEMRLEVEEFTEGMDGHDGSADPFGEVPSTAAGEQRHQAVRKEGVTENIRMVDIIFH